MHPRRLGALARDGHERSARLVHDGALGLGEIQPQLGGARRRPARRLLPADVGQVPAHAGHGGRIGPPGQERVEEVERRRDVALQHALERVVLRGVILRLRDRHVLEAVVLVVGRSRVQVLERRRLGIRDQGLVVEHVRRRDVVEPADAVERRDAQHVERMRVGEERDARAAARALEHVVERRRAPADRRERVVEHLGQRTPAPVGRPLVRVVVGPVLAQVVRAVERRHALEPAVDVGERHARDDRLEGGVAGRDRSPLREAVVAVAPHADVAVRPRLPRDPVDRVVAVGDLVDERERLALRAESPAHVLRDEGVAARDEMRGQERDPAVAAVLVVRQAHEHGGERPGAVGEVHVGGQVHAVAHRHHLLPGARIQRRGPGRRNGHRHAAEACRHRGRCQRAIKSSVQ